MTITEEDVADLRAGDIVRVTGWYGATVEGPLSEGDRTLWLAEHIRVRRADGSVGLPGLQHATLTVVSRAPRALYVNSDRAEPVPGDVVRDADERTFLYTESPFSNDKEKWVGAQPLDGGIDWRPTGRLATPLRLLVDGETGRCVP